MSPPIPVGAENISICVSALWSNISTSSVQQDNEISSGCIETNGNSSHNLPGRYPYYASGKGTADATDLLGVPNVRSPRLDCEQITADSNSENRISGFHTVVNSVSLHLAFPTEKLRKIQQDANSLQRKEVVSVRNLARFVGKTTASVKAIWQAPLHYRALQSMINSIVPPGQSLVNMVAKFSITLTLTKEAKNNLTWWTSLNRHMAMESPLYPWVLDMIVESDASNTGWGARCGEIQTGGRWSARETLNHINYFKLLATFLATQCFAKQKYNITILLKMDNVTAVTYINKLGGTHSQSLCQLALSIWNWCLQQNIFLIAEHLPGKQNTLADEESRNMKDRCDWMLNPLIFNQIQHIMGPLQIDLFASRLTRQLPRFYSWRPDPEAENTDAFSQDWSKARGLPILRGA